MAIYGLMIEALVPVNDGDETVPDGVADEPLNEPLADKLWL